MGHLYRSCGITPGNLQEFVAVGLDANRKAMRSLRERTQRSRPCHSLDTCQMQLALPNLHENTTRLCATLDDPCQLWLCCRKLCLIAGPSLNRQLLLFISFSISLMDFPICHMLILSFPFDDSHDLCLLAACSSVPPAAKCAAKFLCRWSMDDSNKVGIRGGRVKYNEGRRKRTSLLLEH